MVQNGTNRGKGEEITPNHDSERNKIRLFSSEEYSMSQLNHVVGKSKKKEFPCNYCLRKFSSAQALGGHQNAHKEERALDKGGKSTNVTLSQFPLNTYHHYPNKYFSNWEPYNKNPMIPSLNYSSLMFHDFPVHFYQQPTFDFLESEHKVDIPALDLLPQRAPSPILDNPTLNLILQLDCKVGMESYNQVNMMDSVEYPNSVNNEERDSVDKVESLDLTLNL